MEYCEVKYGKITSSAPETERFGAGIEVRNKKYCYFANCHFLQNRNDFNTSSPSGSGGGGMYVVNPGTILIEYCVFHDNYVYNNYIHGNHGSTAYLGWEGVGRFHDNIIVNNEGYSPVLGTTAPNYSHYYNNTIVNNLSEGFLNGRGSGIWTNGGQKIYNNIVYGNDMYDFYPQNLPQIHFERMDPTHPDPTVFCNCVSCPDGNEGSVYDDPQFFCPTSGLGPDYDHSTVATHWALLETSPCRGAGATNMNSYYPDTDFTGNPRVVYGHIDLGAIEYPDLDAVEEQTAQICVYPNPGKEALHILTEWENAVVVVYDLNGRKMSELQVNGYSASIDTESWPSGLYFWKIYSTGGSSIGPETLVKTGKWIKK